jgi:hypothetical protein
VLNDGQAIVSNHHQQPHLQNQTSANTYSLLVEIQSGARVFIRVVRVDLHEMAEHMVGEKAKRQHAAIFGQAVELSGALAGCVDMAKTGGGCTPGRCL